MVDYEELQGVNMFFSNLCVRVICSVYKRNLTNLGQGCVCVCCCGIAVCADPPSGGKAETMRGFFSLLDLLPKTVSAKLIKVPFH